jgi:hypothetical protein
MNSIVITKPSDIDNAFCVLDRLATDAINDGKCLYIDAVDEKPERYQTPKQRSALHVWLRHLAKNLNGAGFTRKHVMITTGEIIDLDWCEDSAKLLIWKPILSALKSKSSTESQSTTDHDLVYRHIVRFFGEKGIECPPWPSR